MWTRKELKDRAKFALKQNYWKIVLVAFLSILIAGGGGAYGASHKPESEKKESITESYYESYNDDMGYSFDIREDRGGHVSGHRIRENWLDNNLPFFIGLVVAVIIVVLCVLAIAILISALVLNPLDVGIKRFFSLSIVQRAEVKEITYAYDHSYKNVAKTMFFRDLYTFLWSLLFVIPGIVKAYEYKMIPYLLAEHPEMPMEQAFGMSRELMHGNKWRAFVLDLSFLGWIFLCIITMGILAFFYVGPYMQLTHAALYRRLMGARYAE